MLHDSCYVKNACRVLASVSALQEAAGHTKKTICTNLVVSYFLWLMLSHDHVSIKFMEVQKRKKELVGKCLMSTMTFT